MTFTENTAPYGQLLSVSNETGNPPKTRLTSAQQAREIFLQDVRNYEKRAKRNALTKGLIDGNPPFSQYDIEKSGQRYRANFNSGEAQAFLEVALTAFYDLSTEVDTFAVVEVELDHPMAYEWGQRLTAHFDWLLRQDQERDYGIQLSQHEMVVFGSGPMVWDDDFDWRSKPTRHRHLRLPYDCKASVNDWPRCTLEYMFTVGELYRYIADEESATARGWNVEAVKQAIIQSGSGLGLQLPGPWDRWETWQQMLRDNEIYWNERCSRVQVARHLFKEFADEHGNEGVTDAWVDVNQSSDKFLFRKDRRFDKMAQVICPFFYDRGDGGAHSIKGLGVKQFSLLLQSTRLLNASVDAAYANSTTMFQAATGSNNINMQTVNLGPYTVIPGGFSFIARNVAGVLDAPLNMRRELQNTLMSNLSQYRQRMDKEEGNPRTATEVQQQARQAAMLGKTQIARYFNQLDDWYSEMFRRASAPQQASLGEGPKLAIAFQKKCAATGVPKEAYKHCRVMANRTIGQGSSFLRTQAIVSLLTTVGPELPEEGRMRLVRDMIASQAGQQLVARYYPDARDRSRENQQLWEAQVENGVLKQGGQIIVTANQNPAIHLDAHLDFADAAAGTVPQGADPSEVLRALKATGAHCGQHLQMMSNAPLREVQYAEFTERLKLLADVTEQLEQLVQKQAQASADGQEAAAQAQAIQQGTDPEMQLKAAKTAADMKLKAAKQGQQMQLRAEKQAQDMALKDARAAQDIMQKRMQAQAETMNPE